jgi:hypothetical protein
MMYHDIYWDEVGLGDTTAAAIAIDGEAFTITPGWWPDIQHYAVPVATASVDLLETDAFIYLDYAADANTERGITLSDSFLPYGQGRTDYADLLAWKEVGEWHIKRLMGNA